MTDTRVSASDAGCWIDGRWGIYGPGRLLDIASSYGFPMDDDDRAIIAAHDAHSDTVTLSTGETIDAVTIAECVSGQGELTDRAEDWLNEHVAPDGYTFGWHDGEFFLWADSEWESE